MFGFSENSKWLRTNNSAFAAFPDSNFFRREEFLLSYPPWSSGKSEYNHFP